VIVVVEELGAGGAGGTTTVDGVGVFVSVVVVVLIFLSQATNPRVAARASAVRRVFIISSLVKTMVPLGLRCIFSIACSPRPSVSIRN
jgi:hypothetical protein